MSSAVSSGVELLRNAAGRLVPSSVNGREQTPFAGVRQHRPQGVTAAPRIHSNADFPANGDKRVPDLATALRLCGLRDGMTISSHHHMRDGDRVALQALQTASEMGAKDLMWFPSASFPCQSPVIDLMERGVVSLGSKMVDPPVVQRALKLVERARRMGLVADSATEAKA